MNRITLYIILVLALINLPAGAVSVNKAGQVRVDYQSKSMTKIVLNIAVDNVDLKSIELNGNAYTNLYLEGAGNYHSVGEPKLPVIRKMIRIPRNAKIDYELTVHSEEYLDLAKNGYPGSVLPAQPYKIKSDAGINPMQMDHKIYDADRFFTPGPVKSNPGFGIGGIHGVMLDYFPISYNPVKNSIKIITKATITINIVGNPALQKNTTDVSRVNPAFEQLAQKIFINNDQSTFNAKNETVENFLVVCGDQFTDDDVLQFYLNWKRQCGFRVIQKSVSDLGATANAIKNYIINQYHSENPPAYVLLIGDVADVPTWQSSVGDAESDAPYTRMDDDFFPDVMVGRFSAADSTDLHAMIQKTLAYEQCTNENLSAYKRITFIATDEEEHDYWQLVEGSHNYVIDTYLTGRGIYSDHIKAHSGGSTADIFQALNDGRTICHYSGHGLETEWEGPIFTGNNIAQLNGGTIPSLVISNACLTGSFAQPECFGETWIRTDDRGAFAFIGASNRSYWEPDDIMERGMYDAYFTDGQTTTGAMLYSGLISVYSETYSAGDYSTYKYYYDIYHLLGDPSVKTRVAIPKVTYADNVNQLTLLSRNFPVTVMNEAGFVENALVTLVQDTTPIAQGYTGIDGIANLPIASGSVIIGDLIMTITADQQIPYIDTIKVTNPSNIVLEPDTISVNQTSDISISVKDDNSNPLNNIAVYASGWTFRHDSLLGMTDFNGQLQAQMIPRYGEALTIYGKDSDDPGIIFIDTLVVSCTSQFTNSNISVSVPEFNIENFLVPGYAGEIGGFCEENDVLLAVRGNGVDTVTTNSSVYVIPESVGMLKAALLKTGYSVFEKTLLVNKAFGTVRFNVTDINDSALEKVTIFGYRYPDTLDLVFLGQTDTGGIFEYPDPISVGYYRIRAQRFGYQTNVLVDTVKPGSNSFFIQLEESPHYRLTGYVTGGANNIPLDASITAFEFSSGVGEEFTTLQTSAGNGGIFQIECPAGDYEISVSSSRYIPDTFSVTITNQPEEYYFHLDTTKASILLVDDDGGKRAITKSDYYIIDEKSGKSSSAAEIRNILESAGYYIFQTDYLTSLNESFSDYDMLISSSGASIEPVFNSTYRSALEDYVSGGGILLIEGGEIGYDATTAPGYPDFARNVLHVSDWKGDDTGPLYRLLSKHELVTEPNILPFQININYYGFGDEDACIPTTDADIAYFNNDSVSNGGIILYENPDVNVGGKTLFYTFAFDKLADPEVRQDLLENSINYLLLEKEYAKGDLNRDDAINILDLTKIVNLILEIDQPGDTFEQWAADLNSDNAINIFDLVRVINIILGRDGFSKPADVDNAFVEMSIQRQELSFQSNSAIAALQIVFSTGSSFQVDPELMSTYKISVRQQGNKLLLYRLSETGILPAKAKLGRFNEAGKILNATAADISGQALTIDLNRLPAEYRLYQNYPNPFNAETVIAYDLPEESNVKIELFDLLGRKVITLVDEHHVPGSYRLQWNGLDRNGRELSSGIYIYSFSAGDFYQLHKMVLAK